MGIEGVPPPAEAGNVLRPSTTVKLSFRLPPTVDPVAAAEALERRLTADPPYGARVTVERRVGRAGLERTARAPWLARALDGASQAAFGQPPRTLGEGGTIPFMAMLGTRFPDAQFVITGVLGPELERPRPERVPAPAHGPPRHRGRRPTSSTPTPAAPADACPESTSGSADNGTLVVPQPTTGVPRRRIHGTTTRG